MVMMTKSKSMFSFNIILPILVLIELFLMSVLLQLKSVYDDESFHAVSRHAVYRFLNSKL